MKPVPVGVWGVGDHAENTILPVLDNLDLLDVRGFWTRSQETRSRVVRQFDLNSYDSSNDMLSDTTLEIIYVATPTGLHYEHGKKVLNADKHLWMEKTFTDSLDKTRDLVGLARNKGKQVKECFMFLHHPHFDKIRSLLLESALGDLGSIHACFGFPHREPEDFRYDPDLGGGALLDVGCYPIRLLRALTDADYSDLTSRSLSSLYTENYDVDVRGYFAGSLEKKVDFSLEWGFGRAYRNGLTLWGEDKYLETQRIFTKGQNYEPEIEITDSNQQIELIKPEPANHFTQMFESFHNDLTSKNYQADYESILQQAKLLHYIIEHNEVKK